MKRMPLKINGRYYNNQQDSINLRLKELFLAQWLIVKHRFKRFFSQNQRQKPLFDFVSVPMIKDRSHDLEITWLGHATFLIQYDGINILTDPLLGDLSVFVPRYVRPPLRVSQLPPIDIILISHNHADHTDISTLKALVKDNPHVFVPEGNHAFFSSLGFSRITEASWWQEHSFRGRFSKLDIVCLPADHWTSRGLFDVNKTLWASWLIDPQGKKIYFGGDAAYSDDYKAIAAAYLIDIALLPIAPIEPRHLMARTHMSPQEAIEAFRDLQARIFIPMHWGTFDFGTDAPMVPLEHLYEYWASQHTTLKPDAKLMVARHGQTLKKLGFIKSSAYSTTVGF